MKELKDELSRKMEEISSKDNDDLRSQLEATREENEQLKLEASKARANEDNAIQMELLQERFDFLQQECTEKDESLATAKTELEKLQENGTKRTSELENRVVDKGAEIEGLRKQLADTQQTHGDAENRLREKEQDILALTDQLQSSGKDGAETSVLRDTVQNKEDEIQKLQRQVQETDFWSTKMERLLQRLGLIGPQGSLSTCWDPLESRLTWIVDQASQIQTPRTKGNSRSNAKDSKRRHTQKRATISTPQMQRATPQVSTQEYQTTQVVYRQHSVRESKSVSPRKVRYMDSPTVSKQGQPNYGHQTPIKPFSQVQKDGNTDGQSSPLSQLTDLSSMFPASPIEKSQVWSGHMQTEPNGEYGNDTAKSPQLRSTTDAPKIGSQNSQKQGHISKIVTERDTECNNEAPRRLRLAEQSTNNPVAATSQKNTGAVNEGLENHGGSTGHDVDKANGPESRKSSIAVTQSGSQDGGQSQGCKNQPKGILKDTATRSSGQVSLTNTPIKGQKAGRAGVRRRQSRTSSAYFDDGSVCSSAARSGGSASAKRGSQTIDDPENSSARPSRPKTRRRTKGNI